MGTLSLGQLSSRTRIPTGFQQENLENESGHGKVLLDIWPLNYAGSATIRQVIKLLPLLIGFPIGLDC